jgi:hypothetical protein
MKKKLNITVPSKVEDIKLGQFQQYLKLIDGMGENPKLNEFVKMKIVSIFCNIPMELVRVGFKASDIDKISTDTLEIIKSMTEDENDEQFIPTFSIGETKFGFMNDLEGMLAGEYADLTSYFDKWDNMHKAMAVMYRPIIKTKYNKLIGVEQYELSEYEGTAEYGELMKSMPAIKAIEASFFLTNSYIRLQKCFLRSMEKLIAEDPKLSTMLKANSTQLGDGIKAFTQSLDKIYSR